MQHSKFAVDESPYCVWERESFVSEISNLLIISIQLILSI